VDIPHPPQRRKLRSRAPVAVAPLLISQLNSEPAAGINGDRFLDVVRSRKIAHSRVGKLVLVEAEVLLDALRHLPLEREDALDTSEPSEQLEPSTVDGVLQALGRRRVTR
jgi:hypothetical protein